LKCFIWKFSKNSSIRLFWIKSRPPICWMFFIVQMVLQISMVS